MDIRRIFILIQTNERELIMTLTNYWWLLIWLFTGGVVLAALIPKSERVLGTLEERWRIVPAVLLVLPYIIWAGYRSDNFGDTYAYREVFKEAPSSLSGLINVCRKC